MKYTKERMERSQLYVDRAVQWIRSKDRYASPIISQGFPDQGDAISWKLSEHGEKYWFRTIDAKEAHQWVDKDPPEAWGGLMLTRDGQLHADWVYMVINKPMTRLAVIDMRQWFSKVLAVERNSIHPQTGADQISMMMPYECFKFYDLEKLT